MLNTTRFENNEHVVFSSDISFRVDDTLFPNAMRMMAEKNTEFSADFDSSDISYKIMFFQKIHIITRIIAIEPNVKIIVMIRVFTHFS